MFMGRGGGNQWEGLTEGEGRRREVRERGGGGGEVADEACRHVSLYPVELSEECLNNGGPSQGA